MLYNIKKLISELRASYLYHFSNPFNLLQILKDNKIKASTSPNAEESRGYVSFTRNRNFYMEAPSISVNTHCALILDWEKMANNLKIKPFNFYRDRYSHNTRGLVYTREQEERILGDVDNIDKYILGILVREPKKIQFFLNSNKKNIWKLKTYDDFISELKKFGYPIELTDN